MDVLFENTHVRTKELVKEIYSYFYFRRKLSIFGWVVFGLSFVINLVCAIFGDSCSTTSTIILILAPFIAILPLYAYIRQVNIVVKRDKEVHGKEIEVTTVVTDEFIQQTASTGSINKITFDNIKVVIQTKNLILLRSKANLLYIFRKDMFIVGDESEFISFLKNKGIKVKRQ